MLPQATDLLLTSNIPHCEGETSLRLDRLNVEADRRDCRNAFVQLYFVENCRLSFKKTQDDLLIQEISLKIPKGGL